MYKLILPIRYLIKRRITYFAVLAVALCVFIVVVVMTVMNGLVSEFVQKNHKFAGDCVVGTDSLVGFAYYEDFTAQLENSDSIEAVSVVIKGYALKRIRDSEEDDVVEIMGVDPLSHSRATGFGDTLYYHKNNVENTFKVEDDPNKYGCVAGSVDGFDPSFTNIFRVAYSISCFPLTARGALAGVGGDIINTKTFYLTDRSICGLPKIDGYVIYLPFEQAQLLCGMAGTQKRASLIHIKFKTGISLDNGCQTVRSLWQDFRQQNSDRPLAYLLETVSVQSWKEFRRESIGPMENEQVALIIMFILVGITTVFIILVVFYMIISHKSKDIGILRSIGVSCSDILEIFFVFAFLVGFIGAVIGILGGALFLWKINALEDFLRQRYGFELWNRTIYAIGDIPNKLEIHVLAIIAASAIIACLCGALIPSFKAARQNITEILQVNKL